MNKEAQQQAEISKLLQDLVELNTLLSRSGEGNSITTIVDIIGVNPPNDPTHKEIYDRISTIVNNNREIYSNIVFKNHSFNVEGIRDDFTAAAFFQDVSNGNIYFTARGTGPGRWIDNAILMFEESSQIKGESLCA